MKQLIAILVVLVSTTLLRAHTADSVPVVRPVASMFMLDVGHASVLDTYLTPITYSGSSVALQYAATQSAGFAPETWVRRLSVGVDYAHVENVVGNNTLHALMMQGQWGMMRRFNHVWHPGLQLMAGGMVQMRGGVIYNSANSNNVVSVKARLSLGLTGMAVYNTRLRRLPVTLAYQASLPLIGVFFSPDYDESYYEMYLGNHSGLAHPGWWGNRFDVTNAVTADFHLGSTILRVGYRNSVERSHVRNLTTHITTHALILGVGGDVLSLSRKGLNPNAKIISSMY